MKAKELEKLLLADGWFEVGQVGSHKHFKHPFKPGKITIPIHKGDLKIKTANAILKQAGIKNNGR
ncbi:MAG: type II toxin-antitoxin system HicA family toxin [Clostridiales bacterium]|nr:type II toxin-antitoxin system HicA family toxin [Clostridiales bacterium]